MAHFAEVDENNIVLRVLVTDNEMVNEGHQWLLENLGGNWIKCSYNTRNGVHELGGTPLRWTYPGKGFLYLEDEDAFVEPSPHKGWLLDRKNKSWYPPIVKPDSGLWQWDDETESWKEHQA